MSNEVSIGGGRVFPAFRVSYREASGFLRGWPDVDRDLLEGDILFTFDPDWNLVDIEGAEAAVEDEAFSRALHAMSLDAQAGLIGTRLV